MAELEGACTGLGALSAEFADQLECGIGVCVHLRAIGHADIVTYLSLPFMYVTDRANH